MYDGSGWLFFGDIVIMDETRSLLLPHSSGYLGWASRFPFVPTLWIEIEIGRLYT